MVAAIAVWGSMTGIRRTSSSDTLRVIVLCYTSLDPTTENGIDRVDFSIVVNGGAPSVVSVAAPDKVFPNYSLGQSPLIGARGGLQKEALAYSTLLDCNALAQGTIVVTANVVSNAGTVTAVSFPTTSITLYNDKGGADSRPNTNVVYLGGESGSDSNDGLTIGAPIKNLGRIFQLYGPNLGGIDIVALPEIHTLVGSAGGADYYCSGHWWANVICVPGARFRSYNSGLSTMAPCVSTNAEFRLRFWGDSQLWEDDGFSVFVTSGRRCHIWVDGGFSQPGNYDPAKPWTVLYGNRNEGRGMVGHDGDVPNVFKYCTSHTRRGVTLGFNGWAYLQDVRITDGEGVMLQPADTRPTDAIINVQVDRHRYARNEVLGYIRASVAGVANITIPSAGRMRLTATGTILNQPHNEACTLHGQLAELVGSTNWKLRFSGGFPAGCNGDWPVVAVGTNFVEVQNPSATAGAATGGATIATVTGPNLKTGTGGGSLYETVIHTDVVQCIGSHSNSVWYGIDTTDVQDMRGLADQGGATITRCAVVNCTTAAAAGNDDLVANWVDSVFIHNNLHHWNCGTYTRCSLVDNVCDHATNFPTTGYLRNNHFISGSSGGTNPTTGAWYASNPSLSPWSLEPLPGNLGTASGLYPPPTDWQWPGASGDSRGAWNDLGGGGGSTTVTVTGLAFEGPVTLSAPSGSITAGAVIVPAGWAGQVVISPPDGSVTAGETIPPVIPIESDAAGGGIIAPTKKPRMSQDESLAIARHKLSLLRSVQSFERKSDA